MGGKVLDLPGFKIFNQGLEHGIFVFIEDKLEDNISTDVIQQKLCDKFDLSEDKAKEYIRRATESLKTKGK